MSRGVWIIRKRRSALLNCRVASSAEPHRHTRERKKVFATWRSAAARLLGRKPSCVEWLPSPRKCPLNGRLAGWLEDRGAAAEKSLSVAWRFFPSPLPPSGLSVVLIWLRHDPVLPRVRPPPPSPAFTPFQHFHNTRDAGQCCWICFPPPPRTLPPIPVPLPSSPGRDIS